VFDSKTEQAPEPPSPTEQRASAAGDLGERLAALGHMTIGELRVEWRRLHRAEPPKKIGRDLLELAVAWKLQEPVMGGLGASVRRQLNSLAREMTVKGDLAKARTLQPRPGARLIRDWQGETHEVLVLDGGFEWRSRHWRSLSAIAREITGTPWSGPRFFRPSEGRQGATAGPHGARAVLELREAADA
jgi:hypothetical protein